MFPVGGGVGHTVPITLTVSADGMKRNREEREIYDQAGGFCLSQGNCREALGGSKWLVGEWLTWK